MSGPTFHEGELIVYRTADFFVKGFVLNDERLKRNRRFGKDYFDELLADWVQRPDAFFRSNEYEVLTNAGKVSKEMEEL